MELNIMEDVEREYDEDSAKVDNLQTLETL